MAKIATTIFTGFLGAGKTCLIRALAEQNHGKKFAFLINEFGDLGIDGATLSSCGLDNCDEENDIIELANGCICCTVADDFLPAMEKILARKNRVDHIIIETSGLALPKPLVKAFNWPGIKPYVSVDSVIAVVDGKAIADGFLTRQREKIELLRQQDSSLDHETPIEELFEEQLQCADLVVLSKADLLQSSDIADVKKTLAPFLRPKTKILTFDGNHPLPTNLLLGMDMAAEDDLTSRPSHHDDGHEHDHQDFTSFSVRLGEIQDSKAFEILLRQLIADYSILRIKGFAAHKNSAQREVIQAVGATLNRYFDRPWQNHETRDTILVFISEADMPRESIILKLKQNTEKRQMSF